MHFDTKLGFFVELHNFFQEAIGTENQIIRFLLGRKGLHLKQTMAVAVHNAQAIGNRAPFESMSQERAQNNCSLLGLHVQSVHLLGWTHATFNGISKY